MSNIEYLFFELIQVAIGTRICLSHTPSADEWGELYAMAKKQSLVGVCFAGLQRLGADVDSGFLNLGLTEMQYLTWMGMAAKIQQKNEVVNRQCVELCRLLDGEGFRSCILKGQGTASLYWVCRDARLATDARLEVSATPSPLTTNQTSLTYIGALRQSGDIDVWVMPKGVRTIKESRARIDELVHGRFPDEKGAFVHIGFPCFSVGEHVESTEVEMHYTPTMDGNPWVERRFKRLFEERQDECFASKNEIGFAVPEPIVNVLFNLHHIKRHFITSGIGLRHLVDFYFILKSIGKTEDCNLRCWIERLGMRNFYAGFIWVMQTVICDMPHTFGIKPNERLGQFMLQEIMQGGNFGHHDERLKDVRQMGFWKRWRKFLNVSAIRARYFPFEVLWSYVFRLRIGIWRKTGIEI